LASYSAASARSIVTKGVASDARQSVRPTDNVTASGSPEPSLPYVSGPVHRDLPDRQAQVQQRHAPRVR
jgi:hypothetical protein